MKKKLFSLFTLLIMATSLILSMSSLSVLSVAKNSNVPGTVNFKLSAGVNTVVLKWSKVSKATGYIAYMKTSPKAKWQRLKTTTGTSFTKTSLKAGTTYYFTVKAYRKVGNKIYNGSFKTKSIKTKSVSVKPYLNVIKDYEKDYGTADSYDCFNSGLVYAKLIDFNDDGIKELLLGFTHYDNNTGYSRIDCDIWAIKSGKAKFIKRLLPYGQNGLGSMIQLVKHGKNIYFVSQSGSNMCINNDYYTYNGSSIKKGKSIHWKGSMLSGWYEVDNKRVSNSTAIKIAEAWDKGSVYFSFSTGKIGKISELYESNVNYDVVVKRFQNIINTAKKACS